MLYFVALLLVYKNMVKHCLYIFEYYACEVTYNLFNIGLIPYHRMLFYVSRV